MNAFKNAAVTTLRFRRRFVQSTSPAFDTPLRLSSSASSVSSHRPPDARYDVLIVGGGPTGSALAARLAASYSHPSTSGRLRTELRIGLIDAGPPPAPLDSSAGSDADLRNFALSPHSLRVLGRCGRHGDGPLRRIFDSGRAAPYEEMQVWDGEGPGCLRFGTADLPTRGEDGEVPEVDALLGACVEEKVLNGALRDELARYDPEDLTVHSLSRLTAVGRTDDPASVRVAVERDGREMIYDASLLVAADGGRSAVRTLLDAPASVHDYGRRAVVASVSLAPAPGARTAYQRFLPRTGGPLALLPLHGERAGVVWSCTPEHSDHLRSLSDAEFVALLNDTLARPPAVTLPSLADLVPASLSPLHMLAHEAERLARSVGEGVSLSSLHAGGDGRALGGPATFRRPPVVTTVHGPRAAFPLMQLSAASYLVGGGRVALLGDAAHTVHPLAGQGLNLGMADAECLAQCVADNVAAGMDVGDSMHLRAYDYKRRADVSAMQTGIRVIHEMFDGTDAGRVWARTAGMDLVNSVGPIRRQVVGAAVGGGLLFG